MTDTTPHDTDEKPYSHLREIKLHIDTAIIYTRGTRASQNLETTPDTDIEWSWNPSVGQLTAWSKALDAGADAHDDLVKALESFVSLYSEELQEHGYSEDEANEHDMIVTARSALAKAKGGTP